MCVAWLLFCFCRGSEHSAASPELQEPKEDCNGEKQSKEPHKEEGAEKRLKLGELLRYLLLSISVEPVLFFVAGGFSTYGLINSTAGLWKVCELYFGGHVNVTCSNMSAEVEDAVQRTMAIWAVYGCMAQFIPLMFIVPIYGAFGDRYGRKWNLVMGICGLLVLAAYSLLSFTFVRQVPLWPGLVVGFFNSFTGFIGTVYTSLYAYVFDETKSEELFLFRLGVNALVTSIAGVLCNLAASQVTKYFSYAQSMLLPLALWASGLLYTLFFLHQVPPAQMAEFKRKKMQAGCCGRLCLPDSNYETLAEDKAGAPITASEQPPRGTFDCSAMFSTLKELAQETLTAMTRRRQGRKRMYLWITVLNFFILNACSLGVLNVFSLYVQARPISWRVTDLAYYNVYSTIVGLLGTAVGMFVLKRLLNLHESTMLMVTLASSISAIAVLACSVNGAMIYLSGLLGCLGGLTFTVCKTLTTQFVEKQEIGKVFSLYQISLDMSIIVGFGGFGFVYAQTVGVYHGLVFFVIMALSVLALIPFIFVHFDFMRVRRKREQTPATTAVNGDVSALNE